MSRQSQRVLNRPRPFVVERFQGTEQPGAGVRVGQHLVQAAGPLLVGLDGGGQLPGPDPPLVAVLLDVGVQPGQQHAGELSLGGGQLDRVGNLGRDEGGRRARLDAAHQGGQVLAVHGRVVELAGRPGGAVPVGVEPAAARAHDGTAAAGLADTGQPELTGPHPGVGRHLVQGVGEDVEAGGRGALVGALERVDLLQLAVGLDDDQIGRGEPQGLGEAGAAAQRGQHRGEEPHRHRTPLLLPAVEDREEPFGVGGGRTVRTWRRIVPGGVREQEVDERRIELGERVEDRDRVVLDVDGAQEPEIEVAVALLPEQFHGLEDQGMTAAPVRVAAVPVVGGPVAVEGDADPDVELVEEVEIPRTELESVGVDAEVEFRDAVEGGGEHFADSPQSGGPRQ